MGGKGGILSEVNVVPLIDILLVLLVTFLIMPHRQLGLQASLPQPAGEPVPVEPTEPIIVHSAEGSLRTNGTVVQRDELCGRLERIIARRAHRVLFLQGSLPSSFRRLPRS